MSESVTREGAPAAGKRDLKSLGRATVDYGETLFGQLKTAAEREGFGTFAEMARSMARQHLMEHHPDLVRPSIPAGGGAP